MLQSHAEAKGYSIFSTILIFHQIIVLKIGQNMVSWSYIAVVNKLFSNEKYI